MTEGATTTRAPRRRAARSARLDWIFALALATFVGVCVWFGRSVYDFLTPPSQTISTPTFTFGTGSSQQISAISTNTGYTNQFYSSNGGTVSNASTAAQLVANLSAGTNTYADFGVVGGTNPAGVIAAMTPQDYAPILAIGASETSKFA